MVFFLKEGITLDRSIEDKISKAEKLSAFFCSDAVTAKASYDQMWEMDEQEICGVAVPKYLIGECGALHPNIIFGNMYEYIMRLVEKTDECFCYFVDWQNMKTAKEDRTQIAETYAFMIRQHMGYWHRTNSTDRLFQVICEKMEKYGVLESFRHHLNIFLSDQRKFQQLMRPIAPFLILRGDDTCGGVLQKFADSLSEALIEKGQAVLMIGEEKDSDIYDELPSMIFKGIIGFQAKALEIEFFRKLNGPKFQFWTDYPLHFKGVLRNLSAEYFVLCQDADYAKLVRDYFHTPNALQFSPGGIIQQVEKKERPYDIVFIAGYFEDTGSVLSGEQREFYDFMLEHPTLTFEKGLQRLMNYSDDEAHSDGFAEALYLRKDACRAVIGHFRKKVVTKIIDAGFLLHVYGRDWENYDGVNKDKLIIHDQVSVEDSLLELQKAKIGLNVMSWHKAGMTERVANIMLSGAVCLSDETTYLKEHIIDGEEAVLFSLDESEQLPILIRKILEDASYRESISEKGRIKAEREFSWEARATQLLELIDQVSEAENSMRIYVATHVPFHPPANPIYVPLHVGREGKADLGYLGDNTGVNISDLNFLYGELTGLFWIWQNVSDVEYVGLCHYRRYFINSEMKELQGYEYRNILQEYDAIVPKHAECTPNYYEHFGRTHNRKDLDAVEHALKRLYPEYGEAYDKAMSGNIFYGGNLMVTRLDILKAYAEWLFSIFMEAGDEIDVTGYDAYHMRIFAFLSEQMFYIFAMANGLKLYEAQMGSTENAETKELKEMLL